MRAAHETPRVDVIVRTLADQARGPQLFRALESIQSQQDILARPIVVVNGKRSHEPVMDRLRNRQGIILHHFPKASAGHARNLGRELVTAPYFMFLDDDDHILPYALKKIIPGAGDRADWDVLITNRYCQSGGNLALEIKDLKAHSHYPLRSLMDENWLSPGASIFRRDTISAELLDVGRFHHEWTHIAFRLVMAGKRLKFLDIPTAVYNDTVDSESKSLKHREEGLRLFEELRMHPSLDPEVSVILERKYHNALHTMAVQYALIGKMSDAWRCHLRSLRPPHTLKYLLFSRRLLFRRRAN